MVRQDWANLNGLWDYAIRPKDEGQPQQWDGHIRVPFPVESALSGVMKRVGAENRLWYRRTFELPSWTAARILLNFGAVDWEAAIWVNGRESGLHRGGYDPFTFDITDAIRPSGQQELVVSVWDPTDSGYQPRGKQVKNPKSIWYTPTTGIWQTVWIEPVPRAYIDSLKIVPDIDQGHVRITVSTKGVAGEATVQATVLDDSKAIATAKGTTGDTLALPIPDAKWWSPDSPFLYELNVTLMKDGQANAEVSSYFGMRKISLGKDESGITRILLNNRPLFQLGPLDQGFWPDGLYTAPTDEALRYDIEVIKQLGFNMVRKHVKIEPARWYYWCYKLGLLVWQDIWGSIAKRFAMEQGDAVPDRKSVV